jgi:hypothetical protein
MIEVHERIVEGLFEARRHQGERPEFHRGENKQSRHAEEQKREAHQINQINIQLFNIPIHASEMPESKFAEKPDSKNSDTGSIFLDIIEMVFEAIGKISKVILPKRKEMPL